MTQSQLMTRAASCDDLCQPVSDVFTRECLALEADFPPSHGRSPLPSNESPPRSSLSSAQCSPQQDSRRAKSATRGASPAIEISTLAVSLRRRLLASLRNAWKPPGLDGSPGEPRRARPAIRNDLLSIDLHPILPSPPTTQEHRPGEQDQGAFIGDLFTSFASSAAVLQVQRYGSLSGARPSTSRRRRAKRVLNDSHDAHHRQSPGAALAEPLWRPGGATWTTSPKDRLADARARTPAGNSTDARV